MVRSNWHIKMMQGIGYAIYSIPHIKELAKSNNIYLDTVLPKLFKDIPNVFFLKHDDETYRTQQKEQDKNGIKYVDLPSKIDKYINPHYVIQDLLEGSIPSYFYKKFETPFDSKIEWQLPDFSKEFLKHKLNIPKDKKIAIIRPATIRAEWLTETRNPIPQYISWCCKVLNEAGYYTISIADLKEREEWLAEGVDNSAQLKLHKGELGIYGTLGLIQMADIVVGGSGFIIPATVSTNTNLFIIFGGRQSLDSVYKVFHPSMNMKKIGWATPANPCRCAEAIHDCEKSIPTLESDFYKFLKEIQ